MDVVVIGLRNEHPSLRAGPCVVQALRECGWNEPVASSGEHQQGHFDLRCPRQRIEGVLEEQGDGDERVLLPGDAAQAVEGRDEHHRAYRPVRGKLYRDPAAEAASEDDDAARVDVVARLEPVVDGDCVGGERRLARPPFAQSVATVVEGCERPGGQHPCIVHLPGDLLRVAAEVEHEARRGRLPGGVPKPAVQPRAVMRRHLDLGGARQSPDLVPVEVRQRPAREDELLLEQVEGAAQPDVHGEPGGQQHQHGSSGQFSVLATPAGVPSTR